MRSSSFLSTLALSVGVFTSALAGRPDRVPPEALAKPRGIPSSLPPRQTQSFGDPSLYPPQYPRGRAALDRRQSNRQIPFVFCPEEFGSPPKLCDQCGGDSLQHGQCDNLLLSGEQNDSCFQSGYFCHGYYCLCTHDGEDHNPQITSTTVVDGQTGTVIWEPRTISAYTNLRASTTVTITEADTTSNAGGGLQTVEAVIFAGGIAWWAISQSGGAAAVAAIRPPTQKPQDSQEDDKQCKSDPKEDCDDCGGGDAVQLCKSGSDAGCPCDVNQKCPDQPPKCSDQQCGGDNGQSQCASDGSINGCLCCPDNPPNCADKDCLGGADQACRSPKWDQCGCEVYAADGNDDGFLPAATTAPDLAKMTSLARDVFTWLYDGDRDKVPGLPKPTATPTPQCKGPTKEIFAVDPGTAGNLAEVFCEHSDIDFGKDAEKDLDGGSLDPKVDLKAKITFTYKHADGKCGRMCTDIFKDVIHHCQYNSHTFAGSGSVEDSCGTYSLETKVLDSGGGGGGAEQPEWKANCVDPTVFTSFTRNQALDAIKDFCGHDISLPAAAQPVWKTYKADGVTLQLVTRWSMAGQDGCHHVDNPDPKISTEDCVARFQSAIDDCNTDTVDKKYGSKPLVWNSPNGCVDFEIYGDGADWDCSGLGVLPLQCQNPPPGVKLD